MDSTKEQKGQGGRCCTWRGKPQKAQVQDSESYTKGHERSGKERGRESREETPGKTR